MRTTLLGVCFALLTTITFAQNGISVGANILSPSVSGDYDLSEKASIRLDLGFFISDNSSISLNPQLLFHKTNNAYDLQEVGELVPYHGPGIIIGINDTDTNTSVQFKWGFELDLNQYPLEVFADAGPAFLLDEPNALYLTSSFGVRYKF